MYASQHVSPDNEITPAEVYKQLAQSGDTVQIIDVREFDEWDAGHIEGADHCPLSLLLQGMRPGELAKNTPIILYCKGGVRSLQALHILKAQGYANVKSMSGGFDAWKRAHLRAA